MQSDRADMKVLVTGATGNLGTAVIRALELRPEVDVIVGVAREAPTWQPEAVDWLSADIASDDLTDVMGGCDAVVNLAWAIQPAPDRDALWRTNVLGTARVLAAVARAKVPVLVHASSIGAYSPAPAGTVVDEDWPTHGIPQLGYSWQKAYVERMLDTLEASTLVTVARMRPALIFRRDVAHEIRRLFLSRAVPTRLFGPYLRRAIQTVPARFQVVHSFDAADAFVRAAVTGIAGAFNLAADLPLGSRPAPGWIEPVAHGLGAAAWHLRVVAAEPGWVDLGLRAPLMDTTRARTVLGWTPVHSAHETLAELLEGFGADDRFPTPPLER
jgi:nucleoside-diphosphate-sugar epimerase